ncbi:S-layer homology domain-containing protein [Paenibacillus sp. P32E]|uniref:S-layer homology domain-containing protein n=1 Tax=Paenibacillus sp. P32E TaxID=1349434 RepID=UPI00095E308A|nr:S-layer homology domain-containing protein [Paenibacillus sp. P32E]OKP90168.1 hypothetical protein A3848_12475 [Paenibacillus sp. P32E]
MKKLILNSLVVVSLVGISLLAQVRPAVAAQQTGVFTDIKGHWAKAAIETAVKNGYFKGYADGTFKPNGTVTRAEFAALLSRVSKVQAETEQTNVFPDLAGHWSEAEVNRAVSLGYINASDYPNGFKPSTPITRMEIAKWMTSGLAATDTDYKQALQDTVTTLLPVKEYFKQGISQSQAPYIAVSLGTKLMSGYPDGSFGLTKQATRAEASAILLRLYNVSQQQASSFVGLNELREVGTKRTNLDIISPFTTAMNSSFNDVAGKKRTFSNNAGAFELNHFIVVDTQDFNNPKGIYAPLFVEGNEDSLDRPGIYRAYMEVTIYPKTEHFTVDHYYNGAESITFGANTSTYTLEDKYGYLTIPYTKSERFFSSYRDGRGVTLWTLGFLNIDRTSYGSMETDDGSFVKIKLKDE